MHLATSTSTRIAAAPPAATPDRAAMQREAEQVVDAWRADHDVPGVAISIRDAGNAVLDIASGVANLRSGRKLTTDDRFFAASTTKMGTAALVLKLAEQGRLDLDSKLAQWFPQIPNAKDITVRSLLKHKAGIPSADRHPDSPAHSDIANGPGNAWSREQMLDFLTNAAHDPRGELIYSNGGYTLLEMIVERQTGTPFDEVFERELLDPVGAKRASVDMGTGGDPTTVAEYINFGTGLGWTNHDPIHAKGGVLRSIIPGGAGGLVSSAADLAKYAEGLLWKRGSSVSPELRERWLRSTDNKDEYGFGIYKTGTHSAAAPDGYGHNGRTFGSIALVEHLPRTQQTIAALTNADGVPLEDLITRLRKVVRKHGFE